MSTAAQHLSKLSSLLLLCALCALGSSLGCVEGTELPDGPMTTPDLGSTDMKQGRPDMPDVDMRQPQPDMKDMPQEDMGMDMMPQEDMMPPVDMNPPGEYPKEATISAGATPGRLLLQGALLLPDRVVDPGELLIVDGLIKCAQASCQGDPQAAGATTIQTYGIISPGLIDGHNHLPYNFLPEWVPGQGKSFTNRYQWADDPDYEEHVRPFSANRSSNTHFCPSAKWGELRSLLHGTTTMQSQSFDRTCIRGGVRNADHSHELQYDHMRTSIASPRDITDSEAMGILASLTAVQEPSTRYAVHMGEGYEGDNITLEFSSFAGRDSRQNRHAGTSLLVPKTSILIHGVALSDAELLEVKQTQSHIVWSPSSNMVLYGRTADIGRILELDISVGIGPDWTVSGEDDLLAELRYAQRFAIEKSIMRLTPQKLWQMATVDGAYVLGLDAFIGKLVPGAVADITVFRRRNSPTDLYEQAINSKAQDVRLVLIGGAAHSGDKTLNSVAWRQDCDAINACGVDKFVCASYQDGDTLGTLASIETALVDILEGTGYPDDEQYKRGNDLLPLIDCSAR